MKGDDGEGGPIRWSMTAFGRAVNSGRCPRAIGPECTVPAAHRTVAPGQRLRLVVHSRSARRRSGTKPPDVPRLLSRRVYPSLQSGTSDAAADWAAERASGRQLEPNRESTRAPTASRGSEATRPTARAGASGYRSGNVTSSRVPPSRSQMASPPRSRTRSWMLERPPWGAPNASWGMQTTVWEASANEHTCSARAGQPRVRLSAQRRTGVVPSMTPPPMVVVSVSPKPTRRRHPPDCPRAREDGHGRGCAGGEGRDRAGTSTVSALSGLRTLGSVGSICAVRAVGALRTLGSVEAIRAVRARRPERIGRL